MDHGERSGATEVGHGEALAIGRELELADSVNRTSALLGFQSELNFESEDLAVIERFGTDFLGAVFGRIGAEVAVIYPPGLRDFSGGLAQVESHGLVVVTTATVHVSGDGEFGAVLGKR